MAKVYYFDDKLQAMQYLRLGTRSRILHSGSLRDCRNSSALNFVPEELRCDREANKKYQKVISVGRKCYLLTSRFATQVVLSAVQGSSQVLKKVDEARSCCCCGDSCRCFHLLGGPGERPALHSGSSAAEWCGPGLCSLDKTHGSSQLITIIYNNSQYIVMIQMKLGHLPCHHLHFWLMDVFIVIWVQKWGRLFSWTWSVEHSSGMRFLLPRQKVASALTARPVVCLCKFHFFILTKPFASFDHSEVWKWRNLDRITHY